MIPLPMHRAVSKEAREMPPVKNGQGQDTSAVGIPHRGAAFIDGETTHTVTVAGGQQAAVYFDIAAVKAGTVEAVFTVSSDALKEKLIQPLVIERPFVFETVTSTGAIAKDENRSSRGADHSVYGR